ncbi:hypothetical protein BVY04_02140 [bacterium M21]|nr:hypothetical protein BVY04_02140 [bacterium M21]
MILSIIVAASKNRAIGKGNDLPWHLPADLKFFKKTTLGHPIIIGRKTFESFGGRPLPRRRNLIITRNPDYVAEGAEVYTSIEAALATCTDEGEVFICGGAQIYSMAFPKANRFYLTEVHTEIDGDTFLPEVDDADWQLISEEFRAKDQKNAHDMTFKLFERK